MGTPSLENVGRVITALSSLAVPIVIGVVGWNVQKIIAQNSLRKDYTDMALRVLAQAETNNQKELRQWAVDILDKNAPLPFTSEVRSQLLGGGVLISHQLEFRPVDDFMKPPLIWVEPPKNGFTTDKVVDNYLENYKRAKTNELTLSALQEQVRRFVQAQKELEVQYQQEDAELRQKLSDITSK